MTENTDDGNCNSAADSVVESDTLPVNQPFTVSEVEWASIKALLDKRYTEIATLLRYNKTKDESIQRLSAEIQKYREGFAFSALKPFLNALIALCEDCRKSVRDAKQFGLDDEKAKKYTDYFVSDFEEMLSNVGLERKDNLISINGKPINALVPPPFAVGNSEPGGEEPSEPPLNLRAEPLKSLSELVDYLKESENAIELAIKDRAIVDKTIHDYVTLASRTDAAHYFALASPVAKQIYGLFDSISKKAAQVNNSSGEERVRLYIAILESVSKEIRDILTVAAGMEIETLDGVFDTKKHKIVKTVPTDDEKLDRTIANIYTDCYSYDEKVFYQSKVDVYKYQNLTQGEQNHG